jgi:hypothetical protein
MCLGWLVGKMLWGKVHVQFAGVQERMTFMMGAIKLAGCCGFE